MKIRNRKAEKASQILDSVLGSLGLKNKLENYKFIAHWEEIVGGKLAKVSKVDRVSQRVVYIIVNSPVWGSEIKLEEDLILERINMFMSDTNRVKEIRFFVGKLD